MERTFWDDERFEERTVFVTENSRGLKNRIELSKLAFKYRKNVIDCVQKNENYISNGVRDCFRTKVEKNYFSDDVWVIMSKIYEQKTLANLKMKEYLILLVDYIMPVVYKKCELVDGFLYCSAKLSCELAWNDLDNNIRKEIYTFFYPEPYEEYVLSESARLFLEKEKYPILKAIMKPCFDISENLRELLKYKDELPGRVYGDCLKNLLVLNTRDVPTNLIKKLLVNVAPQDIMNSDELEVFELLPDVLTIFRGTDQDEKELRLSWSLEKSIASKFASGQLIEARIPKKEAIALLDTGEKEIWAWVKEEQIITRHA